MLERDEEDLGIVGLAAAIKKLPSIYRGRASVEFRRALEEEGFAEFSDPHIISYNAGGYTRQAILIIATCEYFEFDLFYVRANNQFVPVVGRAYERINAVDALPL